MIRTITILPTIATEVKYIRYTGDNFDEVEQFINEVKRYPNENYNFYLSTNGNKEIYWSGHGYIKPGNFVVLGHPAYVDTKWDGFAIIPWKNFSEMVSENIPVDVDEYKEWIKETNKN